MIAKAMPKGRYVECLGAIFSMCKPCTYPESLTIGNCHFDLRDLCLFLLKQSILSAVFFVVVFYFAIYVCILYSHVLQEYLCGIK